MASKQLRVRRGKSPQKADDLILISGIGPTLAGRLYKAGIRTYTQLASLSPVELAAKVNGLSVKQVVRQDWIGQARKLARKEPRSQPHKKETARLMIRQHYQNFTIEFLLDGKNTTHRTRVVHIQSGDADTWAGWQAEQLLDFLARHANIRIVAPKLETPQIVATEGEALSDIRSESRPTLISTANPVPLFPATPHLSSGVDLAKPISQSLHAMDLTGTLRLGNLRVMPIDSDVPIFFIHEQEPYRLGFTLDLTDVVAPNDIPVSYKATILCKQIGGSVHFENETSGTFSMSTNAALLLPGTSLLSGIYRLDAFVSLSSTKSGAGLKAFLKGGLLQVYEASRFHKSSESI